MWPTSTGTDSWTCSCPTTPATPPGASPAFSIGEAPPGFDPDRRLNLPGDSGTASLAADFDGDGWTDIFLLNHKRDGSVDRPGEPIRHTTPSVLYWNGPEGFSLGDRTWLPTVGPHGQILRDPGNIYTRQLAETYVSPPHRFESGVRPVSIGWEAETPLGTTIALQIRTAGSEESLRQAAWRGSPGPEAGSCSRVPFPAASRPIPGFSTAPGSRLPTAEPAPF